MKEPELEEEALRAKSIGNRLILERQTMGDSPGQVDLITPTGDAVSVDLVDKGEGRFEAEYIAETLGLYRAANGELTALAHVGPANPREYADIVSTGRHLSNLAEQTGGSIKRLSKENAGSSLPRIVPVRGVASTGGNDWIGLRTTGASVLKGVVQIPLLAGFLGLALLLLTLSATWLREGR